MIMRKVKKPVMPWEEEKLTCQVGCGFTVSQMDAFRELKVLYGVCSPSLTTIVRGCALLGVSVLRDQLKRRNGKR